MIKHRLLLLIIFASSLSLNAQDLSYKKGDNLVNAGFGLGYYGYGIGIGRSSSIPALTANLELGIHEYFGVGPHVGLVSWNYNSTGFDGGFSILTVGGRGSFHYTELLNELLDGDMNVEKLDLYVTLIIGLEFERYSGDLRTAYGNGINVFFGPVLGARYYFGKSFGVYVEGGRGSLSILNLGITVKL